MGIHHQNQTGKKLFFFLAISFLVISQSYGQYDHIRFKTDFEQQVLTEPEKYSDIEILLAISESGSFEYAQQVRSEILNLKKELSGKKFEHKTEEKKVKLLFNLTHKYFFRKYREISNFDQIFKTKEYNCVSATGLYALILEEYGIPYSIKETPTHVYSIAYPHTRSIVLESTAPETGYYYPDDKDIEKAVASLIELKYFTKEEVALKGTRNLYNEFFYSEGEIDLKKLAGLQYYNETIDFFEKEKYEEALNSNYKSELLYPSEKTAYLSYVLLANILVKAEFKTMEDVRYLAQYANHSLVNKDEIVKAYHTIVNNRLFVESNTSFVDSIFTYLSGELNDSTLIRTISETHYTEFARFYAQKSDFNKSLEYSSIAYELNDQNINIQYLIAQCLVQNFGVRAGNASTISKMKEFSKKFPFLNDHSLYQSLFFYSYTYNSLIHLKADDIRKGMEYLKHMEELIAKFGNELKYDENQYGMVYAEIGAAYFRKHKYVEAKRIIEKGLRILPDHPELKVRLAIVVDEMK